jgi:hypothetical protein
MKDMDMKNVHKVISLSFLCIGWTYDGMMRNEGGYLRRTRATEDELSDEPSKQESDEISK